MVFDAIVTQDASENDARVTQDTQEMVVLVTVSVTQHTRQL